MVDNGWIKLHRKFIEWEWFDNPKMVWLFMKCLLLANHEGKRWHGVLVDRGSFITSYENLSSKKAHMGVQSIRTLLKHLKSTGELTIKTTNKYTLVTINNYNQYQQNDSELTGKLTHNQQSTNRQLTTNKNDKNIKNNIYSSKNYLLSVPKEDLEQISKDLGVTEKDITFKGKQLFDWCESKGKIYKNYKAFLKNCLRTDGVKQKTVNLLQGGIRYEDIK